MFAGAGSYATLTFGGLIASEKVGTHTFHAGVASGSNVMSVRQTTAGTANLAGFYAGQSSNALQLYHTSTTFTPAGVNVADGGVLLGANVGGMAIAATHASGTVKFFPGGTTERMRLLSTGELVVSGTGTFTGLSGPGGLTVYADNGSTYAAWITQTRNGTSLVNIKNTTNGTAALSGIYLSNDAGNGRGWLIVHSSGYTTSGPRIADGVALYGEGAGGLSYWAAHASGTHTFYTGAAGTLRGTIASGGSFEWDKTIRAAGEANPAAGAGLELYYDTVSTFSGVRSYDRGGAAWRELRLESSLAKVFIAGTEAMRVHASRGVSIGATTDPGVGALFLANGLYADEIADPAAPASNRVVLYAKDSGGGKTQIVARFNTGAVQILATEP